jgi:hypothetical protein
MNSESVILGLLCATLPGKRDDSQESGLTSANVLQCGRGYEK